ncbi:MAG: DUF1176 domain-containing protein [Caulobacteraceae bacterium]|nr:DUF1176 domain-containing protein [Caulobacteraceae bacterium]
MKPAIVVAAAMLALAAPAAAQEAKSFKSWSALCDNLKTCTAFGYTDEAADTHGFVRLVRAAGPNAPARVTLRTETEDGDDGKRPLAWSVSVDGHVPPGLQAVATTGTDEERRAELSPAQAAALIAAVRNGSQLTLAGGKAPITLSLAGSSAALLWIDDRQGRVGTVTALAAKGARPASAVPAAPAAPVVRAAPAISQAGLPTRAPKAILDNPKLKDCDDPGAKSEDTTIARLGAHQILWGVPCSAGAYNLLSVLFVSDEAGRGAREIVPPDAEPNNPDADDELMNINYDPETRTLTAFAKARGIGDCGEAATWVWDGQGFRLLDETVMGQCQGVVSDDWPSLYHAVRAPG